MHQFNDVWGVEREEAGQGSPPSGAPPGAGDPPKLIAAEPGQVFSWDITKLTGPVKGKYFDAYVMIDIYSRYIIGAYVHAESRELAVEIIKEIFGIHGVTQVFHADRGTSMTSKTVARLLSDLEVTKSNSRPRVRSDRPHSEAWFKTLKFAPTFPERFGCLAHAKTFMASFVAGYSRRYFGIGLNTPADKRIEPERLELAA